MLPTILQKLYRLTFLERRVDANWNVKNLLGGRTWHGVTLANLEIIE